jgi:hypothetical protein
VPAFSDSCCPRGASTKKNTTHKGPQPISACIQTTSMIRPVSNTAERKDADIAAEKVPTLYNFPTTRRCLLTPLLSATSVSYASNLRLKAVKHQCLR